MREYTLSPDGMVRNMIAGDQKRREEWMDDGGGRWRRGREQKKTKIEGLINNSGAEEHYYLIRAEVQLYSDSKSVLYCLYLTENDVCFILKQHAKLLS